jgi:hypothetical protein
MTGARIDAAAVAARLNGRPSGHGWDVNLAQSRRLSGGRHGRGRLLLDGQNCEAFD